MGRPPLGELLGRVDPDGFGRGWLSGEAFWMGLARGEKGLLPVVDNLRCQPVVDGNRGQGADAAVAVLGVVPREELPAEGQGVVEAAEAVGVAGVDFQGLECAFGEEVIVRDVRRGEALGRPEVVQLLAEGEGRHGGGPFIVEGELARLDASPLGPPHKIAKIAHCPVHKIFSLTATKLTCRPPVINRGASQTAP